MVVKSELKLIKNLQQKKYRNEHGLFVVEGKKTVEELLESDFRLYKLFLTKKNIDFVNVENVAIISEKELRQMSSLKNPNGVLGVFYKRDSPGMVSDDWVVMLDGVQDPGNMGTIIRLCDWFGIKTLVCSLNTVDCYNPKVLQATMGSIARVAVIYTDLETYLVSNELPVYGTFMDGNNVYKNRLPEKGVLVMGNEGNGISERVQNFCTGTLSIPQFNKNTAESLNVATATAILLSEIRRG
ncbi:TrmH family RNA methyltransferase [Maribacter thermophilus]|uniref:TrmH family RNA methyltransferase n=1 Tax=Maribacter thermophilus TaxID=1197874 RepID=UPI00064133AD|nr:RNA methyltransferase [Maribacter thermophilus]